MSMLRLGDISKLYRNSAMASKSAESEALFEKKPVADIEQEKDLGESAPFGPVAPLKSFKTDFTLNRQEVRKRLLR